MTKHLSCAFNQTLQFALFAASLGWCCQLAAHTSQPSYNTAESLNQKSIPQLKHAFDKQRFAFLSLFKSISETAKSDMICRYHKPVGSQVASKNCEPRYVSDFRSMLEQKPSQSGIDINRLPSDEHLRLLTQDTREESFEHVAALIATHPELYQSFTRLDDIHQRMQQQAVSEEN